jgi:hypothetical protein
LVNREDLPIPPGTCKNFNSRKGLWKKKMKGKPKKHEDFRMRNSSLDEMSAFESTRMNFTAAEEHKMREQKVNVKIK